MGHSRNICSWVIYYFILWYQSQNIQIFYQCSYLCVLVTSVFSFFQQYCISIVAWCIEHSALSRMFYAPFHSNGFNKKEAQDRQRRELDYQRRQMLKPKGWRHTQRSDLRSSQQCFFLHAITVSPTFNIFLYQSLHKQHNFKCAITCFLKIFII